ncbi:DUF2073 domain-containing protein [Candidatus Woesearchaeota archaeon]|nr:DUF2073 domain-containing protein [Candidatus Woesearchaeota archaeon]
MLTLQFIPYHEIEHLSSTQKILKLLKVAKEDKIVLLEGRLKKQEETDLIKITMEEIDDRFKGIEMSVIYPDKQDLIWYEKMKRNFISLVLGNREGFTIIGPASIVREIRKDPNKIQLFTTEPKTKKRKK